MNFYIEVLAFPYNAIFDDPPLMLIIVLDANIPVM